MIFEHLKSIYRDFDIRGKFGEEITEDEVYKIGKATVMLFKLKKVAIGRDIRPSADALFEALSRGVREMGAEVIDLGLCTTPMTYFICGSTDVDATIMITASHMPSEYNGLKISIEDAKPVTGDFLQQIKDIVGTHTFSEESTHGSITTHALQSDWIAQFKARHTLKPGLSVVIDPANMIGILEIDTFKAFEPELTVHTIFDTYDHTSPNHEANPMKYATLESLGAEVVEKKADLGIAFDGDADRVGFVDEHGVPVASDMIGTLLARAILKKNPQATVICDIRSSRALVEEIEKNEGTAIREKVGHTHIKTSMRKHDAVLGVELSGHFFFKETYFSEGGALPAFLILELLQSEQKTLSQLVAEVKKYFQSGEVNSTVTRSPDAIYADIKALYPDATMDTTDGLTLSYDAWWCNIRPSANDPVMRLNLEANTQLLMEEKRDALLEIIRS